MKVLTIEGRLYRVRDYDLYKLEELESRARNDHKQEGTYREHLEFIEKKYKCIMVITNGYRYP